MAVEPHGAGRSSSGKVVSISSRTKAQGGKTFTAQTGGPTDGDGESWRSSVERQLGELRTDMRHMFIGGAGAIVLLVGAGWWVYRDAAVQMREIAVQQQSLAGKLDTMDARMSGKFETLGVRLEEGRKSSK